MMSTGVLLNSKSSKLRPGTRAAAAIVRPCNLASGLSDEAFRLLYKPEARFLPGIDRCRNFLTGGYISRGLAVYTTRRRAI